MVISIFPHHVLAHENIHESAWLVRRKHCDVLFARVDVITAGDQRCIEFRHKADWGMGPHFSQRWEGVIPKGRRIMLTTGALDIANLAPLR